MMRFMFAKLLIWMVLAAALLAAPARYRVRLDTSKGPIVIEVNRAQAPRGADRFHELVAARYFDDTRFFRVVQGKWAQFGINGDPAVAKSWRARTFADEDTGAPRASTTRGAVAFAFAEPGGRSTQLFISLRDNASLDAQGFVPIGRVVEGMDVADALFAGYGESAGGGIRGGKQGPLFEGGNEYLDRYFPRLDRIARASIVE